MTQDGTHALRGSPVESMVPQARTAKFFGFFSTGEKFAGIIGPAVFGVVGQVSGSRRWGIVSLIFLFAVGALLLCQVDQTEGRRLAKTIDASA